MHELSGDEVRYLLAAFSAIPQDWFRPQAVGRAMALSEQQTDRIVESLAGAGMLVGSPDRHARLTEAGRKEASRVAALNRRPVRRGAGVNSRVVAAVCLALFAGFVVALLWFTKVL